jgi:uncharacterized protein YkwD
MIAKITLCALALAIGGTEQDTKQPAPAASQSVVKAVPAAKQKAEQKTPAATPAKSDAKTSPQASATAKAAPAARQPAETKEKDKEINGVRLIAIEASLVSYTNEERARYGLQPFEVDKELMESARGHAIWMTRNRAMVHTNQPVAENIAMGQPDCCNVVRTWMNSPGHRANILNSWHRRIGVAAYCTEGGTIFWCQQFQP